MATRGSYCVLCEKHLAESVRTCCTADSVVGTAMKGWFRRRLVYVGADGRELDGSALQALAEKERAVKEEAERKAREEAERKAREEAERKAREEKPAGGKTLGDMLKDPDVFRGFGKFMDQFRR